MDFAYDPVRQAGYIQQCLSQNKRPIGFFLAAGCSMAVLDEAGEPLIPNIEALTKIVAAKMTQSPAGKDFAIVLKNLKTDGNKSPNIEEILTHIRGLNEVAGQGEARGLKTAQLDGLDAEVCGEIVAAVTRDLPGTATPFHRLAAWVKGTTRDSAVEIFTTNYDLLIEQGLETHRVPYFDGFVGGRRPFFDSYAIEEDVLPPRWARLSKLHGSVNWRQTEQGTPYRCEGETENRRYMIYPSHLKYDESRRMPYLAMLDRLRQFLRMPSAVLVVCGYSFGDKHLNTSLVDGLQGNPRAMMFGLGFDPLDKYPGAVELAETCGNFSFLARDKAVIGTRTAAWLERPAAEDLRDSIAVEWEKVGSEERRRGLFLLGDFAKLGDFLAELIGAERAMPEEPDAK